VLLPLGGKDTLENRTRLGWPWAMPAFAAWSGMYMGLFLLLY
jgi:hypothetical protein